MGKTLSKLKFIEEYEVKTLATVAGILAVTVFVMYKMKNKLEFIKIDDVDTSQMDELKMLFDDEDWDDQLESLFNFATDLAPELI